MKKTILLAALVFLGCVQPIKVDVPDIEKSQSVVAKDLRPLSEKESKVFSVLIVSPSYGIFRRGDEFLTPSAPRLLQHRVFQKFSSNTQPVEVTIHHMVVYLNGRAATTRSALAGGLGGMAGAGIAATTATNNNVNLLSTLADRQTFDSLAEDEYKRALYTDIENPENASVFVVYLDAEINGKRVFVKTMTPADAKDSQNPLATAVESTIQYYLSQY